MNEQALYFRLGQLLTAMPGFGVISDATLEWVGEVQAIVNAICQSAFNRNPRIASSDNVTESGSTPRQGGRDSSR